MSDSQKLPERIIVNQDTTTDSGTTQTEEQTEMTLPPPLPVINVLISEIDLRTLRDRVTNAETAHQKAIVKLGKRQTECEERVQQHYKFAKLEVKKKLGSKIQQLERENLRLTTEMKVMQTKLDNYRDCTKRLKSIEPHNYH